MSRSKHTEAQMIAAVKQMEAGRKAEDVAREVGVSAPFEPNGQGEIAVKVIDDRGNKLMRW